MGNFQYGLRARPFNADPKLSECDWIGVELNPTNEQKKEFGSAIRHGILETNVKLDDEFVLRHELVDLSLLKNSPLNKAIKVIDYLVKRESYNMFLTPNFYNQIQMSADEFLLLCAENGYDSEDELYTARENLLVSQTKEI